MPRYGRLWSRPVESCRKACGKRAELAEEIEKALRAIGHGLEIGIGLAGLSSVATEARPGNRANGKLVTAERECREAQIETISTRERIAKAMRSAGVDVSQADDVAAMLAAGQTALDRAVDAKNLRATIEDRRRDLRFREKKLGDARLGGGSVEQGLARGLRDLLARPARNPTYDGRRA